MAGGAPFGRADLGWALVPLTVLSLAWTIAVVGLGDGSAVADRRLEGVLPDGSRVPAAAVRVPASVSGNHAPGGARTSTSRTSSATGIPAAALAAYQRAGTVIDTADPSCHLTWQLVAAIGRVESDHGRTNGSSLDREGLARPRIYGPPLDGRRGTTRIVDTDAGEYDDDTSFDRAVGPMQLIPSTWAVVGVDADGDGTRNPQDIDDAALATAVHLCSGEDDLATRGGRQAALLRYNSSQSYVDLVLSIMDAYLDGEFSSVPNGITSATVVLPDPPAAQPGPRGPDSPGGQASADPRPPSASPDPSAPVAPADQPSTAPTPSTTPTKPPGGGNGGSSAPGSPKPPQATVPALPSTSVEPVDEILTHAQAVLQCTLDGYVDNPLRSDDPFDRCVEDYTS